MLTVDDAVMALSNSGNTAELSDIVAFTRRSGSRCRDDQCAGHPGRASRRRLDPPKAPEACPMGLAPTTSTTVMLALGDLAVALWSAAATPQDFQVLHPGGSGQQAGPGQRADAGPRRAAHRGPETPVAEAILVMTQSFGFHRSFGCVGSRTPGRLIGIVTDGDLRRHMNSGLLDRPQENYDSDPAIRPRPWLPKRWA